MLRASRRERIELSVFLLLFFPMIALTWWARPSSASFVVAATATILHDIGLTALVLYFVWSHGEPLASIGLTRRHAGRDAALGVLLYIALFAVLVLVASLVGPVAPRPRSLVATEPLEHVLGVVLVLVVACAEETIFRGYLLVRLRNLTGSNALAIAISTLLFASGHAYQGVSGMVLVGVMGLVFALVAVWRRSLVAPIVMHVIQDLLGLIVIPLVVR